MISSTFETDLRLYCNNKNSQLFEDKLYLPLKYMASFIAKKYNIDKDIDVVINDLISHASITLPVKFDIKKKGTAKSLAYILMSQYLLQQIQYENRDKRSMKKTIFIEDVENFDGYTSHVIETEMDEMIFYKNTLIQNKDILENLRSKLNKKIAKEIIKCIKNPSQYECINGSYVIDIAKKSNTRIRNVYRTIEKLREKMTQLK